MVSGGDETGGDVDGATTNSPTGHSPAGNPPAGKSPAGPSPGATGPQRPARSSRVIGLVAAVGFSLAMWAFIAMAVLGIILKVLG